MSFKGSWTRGVRCGVHNCSSRLWRVVNGLKMCQNGHIVEGDIQMEVDDDEFFNSGGRRTTKGSQKRTAIITEDTGRLYGKEGHILYIKCLQILVQQQVRYLIESQNAPTEIEGVARALFGLYCDSIWEDASMDLEDDSFENNVQLNREPSQPSKKMVKLPISITHLVSITYLSCLILRLPIYQYDILRWIIHDRFPYMNPLRIIPKPMLNRLGMHLFTHFRVTSPPNMGQLFQCTNTVAKFFFEHYKLEFPIMPIQPLAFKMIRDLFLPPEIYPAVIKLLQVNDANFDWSKTKFGGCAPDSFTFCAIFVSVKLCFGFDNVIRIPKRPNEPCKYVVDWELWASMVRRVWVEDESFYSAGPLDSLNWDNAKIVRYLAWVDKFHTPDDNDASTLDDIKKLKRVMEFFPRQQPDNLLKETMGSIEVESSGEEEGSISEEGSSDSGEEGSKESDSENENVQDVTNKPLNHISHLLRKGFYAEREENDFFQSSGVESNDEHEEFKMALNRKLLPVRKASSRPVYHTPSDNPDIDVYPSTSIITEISQLVQSTTSTFETQLTKYCSSSEDDWEDALDDDIEDEEECLPRVKKELLQMPNSTLKGIKLRPGERFPHKSMDQNSEYTKLLMLVGHKITGTNITLLNQIVGKMERSLIRMSK